MSSTAMFALLDSLSGTEVLMILVVALIVLGPEKLPQMARQMGVWAAKLRALTQNLQSEVRDVLDDPAMQPLRDISEFAAQPRRKLTELALAAEAEAKSEADAQRRRGSNGSSPVVDREPPSLDVAPTADLDDDQVVENPAEIVSDAPDATSDTPDEVGTREPSSGPTGPTPAAAGSVSSAPARSGPAPIVAKWRVGE